MHKQIRRFIDDMKKYYAFFFVLAWFGALHTYWAVSNFGFEAVDLPHFQFFLFSLWSCVRNIVTYTLLIASVLFFCGRFAIWVLMALWFYVVVVISAIAYVDYAFHANLSSVLIELCLNTSADEVLTFVKMSLGVREILGLVLVLVIIALPAFVLGRFEYPKVSRKSIMKGCCLALPFVVFNMVLLNWHWGVAQMPYTTFAIDTFLSYQRHSGFRQACENKRLPANIGLSVPVHELPNVVIVIGESSTRNNWHLYGYERQTTPRMDALCSSGEAIALSNVVGIAPETVTAMSFLLTDVVLESQKIGHWTLAEIMRRAGYNTSVLSNQLIWEGNNSQLALIFNGCTRKISLLSEFKGASRYDEQFLPYLKATLSQEGPQAIFIHLAGMHYPVHNACPPSFSHFVHGAESELISELSDKQKDRRNRYDDGILYEDFVLGEIVEELKSKKGAAIMFFISDHGESPRSEGWRIYTDMDVYEIPCVVWLSDEYKTRFPNETKELIEVANKRLQPDLMTVGLLELFGIEIPEISKESFLRQNFKCRDPRRVEHGRVVYEEK